VDTDELAALVFSFTVLSKADYREEQGRIRGGREGF